MSLAISIWLYGVAALVLMLALIWLLRGRAVPWRIANWSLLAAVLWPLLLVFLAIVLAGLLLEIPDALFELDWDRPMDRDAEAGQ